MTYFFKPPKSYKHIKKKRSTKELLGDPPLQPEHNNLLDLRLFFLHLFFSLISFPFLSLSPLFNLFFLLNMSEPLLNQQGTRSSSEEEEIDNNWIPTEKRPSCTVSFEFILIIQNIKKNKLYKQKKNIVSISYMDSKWLYSDCHFNHHFSHPNSYEKFN